MVNVFGGVDEDGRPQDRDITNLESGDGWEDGAPLLAGGGNPLCVRLTAGSWIIVGYFYSYYIPDRRARTKT